MKKLFSLCTACLLLSLLAYFSLNVQAKRQLNCLVVGVSDGDTIRCLLPNKKNLKVRLQGIDAPEKAQPFGKTARQALAKMIFKQQVQLNIFGYDRYQRTLAQVSYAGKDVNLAMLEQGMAWAYRQYNPPAQYIAAEQKARQQHLGLWQDPKPIAPQDWRHKQKTQSPKKQSKKTREKNAAL